MDLWHAPRKIKIPELLEGSTKCAGRLAGSVMAKVLSSDIRVQRYPEHFRADISGRLKAIDAIRGARPRQALIGMHAPEEVTDEICAKLQTIQVARGIPRFPAHYHENRLLCKADIVTIANICKRHGV